MRLNTFLCGRVPLKKGVNLIGAFDITVFLLDVVLAILCALGGWQSSYFMIPVVQKWVIALKIVLVDFMRVCAYGLLLKREEEER